MLLFARDKWLLRSRYIREVLVPIDDPQTPPWVQHHAQEAWLLPSHEVIRTGIRRAVASHWWLDWNTRVATTTPAGTCRARGWTAGLVGRELRRTVRRASGSTREHETVLLDGTASCRALRHGHVLLV